MAEDKVTYRAKSVVSSKLIWTNILGLVVGAAGLPQFGQVLPPQATEIVTAVLPIANILLRIFGTTRPVAFIAPGDSKPVSVEKL